MASALERIRAATDEQHRRLEALPYSESVLAGTLPIALYRSYLRALLVVHRELERAVEHAALPALGALPVHGPARRGLLERDLQELGVDPDQVDAAALQACVLAQELRLAALSAPARLVGALYVLEGSQLGNLVQHAALKKQPAYQHGGLSYLAGVGSEARAQFSAFLVRLELALSDEAAVRDAIAGAQAMFTGFERILGALDPAAPSTVTPFAELLNPDAGTHSLPEDVREVDAALRAGEQSYRQTPYYLARYGERGLRFTRSDSAWLVSLARLTSPEQTLRQVRWLGRTLASRGMPQLLLEQHLRLLHDVLVQQIPERAQSYASLRLAAEELESDRMRALPGFQTYLLSLPMLADEHGIRAGEAGSLVLGALADELQGMPRAVPSLTSWLCERERFSPAWCEALEALLVLARAAH